LRRTELQDEPAGDAMWAKEAQLINQMFTAEQWRIDST
jgi:hypothetical protein